MKIASWNVARGLSSADKAKDIVDGIDRLDADIVFLPEAFDKTGELARPDFAEKLGYDTFAVEYEDKEEHPSEKQYIVALSRVAALLEHTRLGTRNAIAATTAIEGEPTSIIGVHFDDRNEITRLGMVDAFLEHTSHDAAKVLIGDLNAMHGNDVRAKLLASSSARSIAASLKNDRLRSLATRLTDMASGDVMRELKQAGMKDADPRHRPTMLMSGLAIAQLDHIMHDKKLVVTSFEPHKLKGSDHKAVSGTLQLAQ